MTDPVAAAHDLVCRCGAVMCGPPQSGQVWLCNNGHRFRVTAARSPISALALRGDRASGVETDRTYYWRVVAGTTPTKPSPR